MSADAPLLSVVVPTRDRNDALGECLDRLAPGAQTLTASSYEVIVTDDSETGAARPLLEARYPWARWNAGPRRGPASNRNAGAAAACGEIVVFVDDDCLPETGWLAGYADARRDRPTVYEGRTTCREGVTSPRQTAPENLTGGVLWSCNFAMPRAEFARLGGFDERFPFAHLEDVDLLLRIRAAGLPIVFVPHASVDHPQRRLPFGSRQARVHQAGVLFMHLHPPVIGLAHYLYRYTRARAARVARLPKSLDSLREIGSVAVESVVIARRWREWTRWATDVARKLT